MKLSRVFLLSAVALPILALSQSVRPPTSGTWDLGQPTFPWENTYSLNLHGQQAAIGGLIIVGPEALANGGGPLDVALDSTTWSGTQGGPTVHTGHVTVISGTFTAPSIVGDNSIARATGDTYTGTHAFGGATVTGISRLDASDGSPAPALSVDASGNVGIGTTTPDYTFHVEGASHTYGKISSPGVNTSVGLFLENDGVAWLLRNNGASNSDAFEIRSSNNSNPSLVITTVGNVGIGTTAPAGALDVVGDWALIGGNTRADAVNKSFRMGMSHYLASELPPVLVYGTSSASDNVAVWGGGTSSGHALTQHRWNVALNNAGGAGSEAMRLDSTGLGIGTTNPSAKLDVVGDAEVSGTVTAGAIVAPNNINVTSSGQTAAGKGEHWHLTQDAQIITCPTPFTGAIFDVTTRNGDHAFEIEPHSGGQLWQIGASAPVAADGTIEIQFGKCQVFWDGTYWMVDGN